MLPGLAIIFFSFITFFINIASYPLLNWDEAWYAEEIKNMATGAYGYIVPFWNSQYYFDKPPLYFWLSLPFFKLFGPGEWQARIVSASAAVITTLLVYLIGKKLFSPVCGIISALVFLTLGQVVIRFSHGNLDGLLVCLFLSSFYTYLLSTHPPVILIRHQPEKDLKNFFSILTGLFLGLGFLTKGWFLGLFPALLVTLYSVFSTKKLPKNLGYIIPSALISSGWWYLLGAIKFGKPFINWYLLNPGSNLLRSPTSSLSLSYVRDLIRDIGLWWILVIFVILSEAKNLKKILQGQWSFRMTPYSKILSSFAITSLLFILPLNFLSEKLGWYNLPAYPLVAIIIGYFVAKLRQTAPKLSFFLVGIILITQILNVIRIENKFPDRSQIGADLGKHARNLIPKEDTVILDDHDFTSFLYYSDHKTVYLVQKNGGKLDEWWAFDYPDLPQFIKSHKKTWIITPNPNNLPKDLKNPKIEDTFNDYTFLLF